MIKKQSFLLSITIFILVIIPFISYSNYDSTEIRRIIILGNEITKQTIIERELSIKEGQVYTPNELDSLIHQSRVNLVKTSLFNFVDISTLSIENGKFSDVFIRLTERWYFWPIPLLEFADRDFNNWWPERDLAKLSYGLNLEYRNFRGRKELLQFQFMHGFDRILGLRYDIPYLNSGKTFGATASATWTRRHAVPVATKDDKVIYNENGSAYGMRRLALKHRTAIQKKHSFKSFLCSWNGSYSF